MLAARAQVHVFTIQSKERVFEREIFIILWREGGQVEHFDVAKCLLRN